MLISLAHWRAPQRVAEVERLRLPDTPLARRQRGAHSRNASTGVNAGSASRGQEHRGQRHDTERDRSGQQHVWISRGDIEQKRAQNLSGGHCRGNAGQEPSSYDGDGFSQHESSDITLSGADRGRKPWPAGPTAQGEADIRDEIGACCRNHCWSRRGPEECEGILYRGAC